VFPSAVILIIYHSLSDPEDGGDKYLRRTGLAFNRLCGGISQKITLLGVAGIGPSTDYTTAGTYRLTLTGANYWQKPAISSFLGPSAIKRKCSRTRKMTSSKEAALHIQRFRTKPSACKLGSFVNFFSLIGNFHDLIKTIANKGIVRYQVFTA
jgi:hypothetical protein